MTADADDGPRLVTKVGKAIPNDNLFRGHSVAGELAGRESVWSVLSMAVGGPRLDAEQSAVLDDVTVCCLAADPRIWPLKSTRLASSFGSTVMGVAVGMLASDGARIGPRLPTDAAEVLEALSEAVGPDPSPARVAAVLDDWAGRGRHLVGFGVPFRRRDERVEALRRCIHQRGRQARPAWHLLELADQHMESAHGLPANIAAGIAAAVLDLGLRPPVLAAIQWAFFNPCYWANAHEGSEQQEPVLKRLPESMVEYVGPGPRVSPRRAREDEPR